VSETKKKAAPAKKRDPAKSAARPRRKAADVEPLEAVPDTQPDTLPDLDSPDARAVAAQIHELESRLDKMIHEARQTHGAQDEPPPSPPTPPVPGTAQEATVFDTARELLSTDFYLRKWGRLGMRNRSEEVDDFGFDPVYEQRARPVFNFLYERYFRVECDGVSNVPDEGRCLLVANHSGTLPYDGVMLKTAIKREHAKQRDVRWLTEDFIFHFPFVGAFSNRIGAVRACQENAERLLRQDALVAVFPEGLKGIGKLYKDRYRLQRFGRGGFIKLCLRTGTPIVPVAIVGAEETNPMLMRIERVSSALGLPYIPVTPTFPALGPLGLLPAPTKWKITFGEVLRWGDEYAPEAAEDEILVGRLAERVRAKIQGMLDHAIGERRSVWFG
jgi:1-acyl-sn-glycerol-3-phosphate acyltransferase